MIKMNKEAVIDSNVFAKIFIKEKDSQQAKKFLDNCLKEETAILVPSVFLYEIMYISQKKNKNSREIQKYFNLQINIQHRELTSELVNKSLEIIERTSHKKSGFPSFYDSTYHALAILNRCDFITADRKHYEKTKQLGNIKLLEDLDL